MTSEDLPTDADQQMRLIASKLIDVYWMFYWQGYHDLAMQTAELMCAAGIDSTGRIKPIEK